MSDHPKIEVKVSLIHITWLRRAAICVTFPFMLLYTFTWVPFACVMNGIIKAVSLPFMFTRDMLRNARELW